MKKIKERLKHLLEYVLLSQAKRVIARYEPKMIAVTGSFGKTSTKRAVSHVLSGQKKVRASSGSYNTKIGLPLGIFGHKTPARLLNVFAWLKILLMNEWQIFGSFSPEVVVVEMGADHPGDIAFFMEHFTPDIGIVTAVAPVHTDNFGSVKNILEEKWKLAEGSKKALINTDDKRLKQKLAESDLYAHTYGLTTGEYQITDISYQENGCLSAVMKRPEDSFSVDFQVIAEHSLFALSAVVAVADLLEICGEEIHAKLESFVNPPGRMRLFAGKKNTRLIDDSYNASPDAVLKALETLRQFPRPYVAVLGSMNELGDMKIDGHRDIGHDCSDLDRLITIGEAARKYTASAAKEAGLAEECIDSFSSPYEAGAFAADVIEGGETILIKGSQNGVFSEEVTKQLLKNSEDESGLVRQSAKWQRIKKEQFRDSYRE